MSATENKKNQSSGWYKDVGESPQVDTIAFTRDLDMCNGIPYIDVLVYT